MKQALLISFFSLFWLWGFSQAGNKLYEKTAEKYSVASTIVLNRTFNVGDTITLESGSGPNGEFISVRLFAGSEDPFSSNAIGRKFIILKIYHKNDGLNSFDQLVCEFTNKLHVYIDPIVGLTRKEIK